MKKSGNTFGRAATRGRENAPSSSKKLSKQSSLTSSATDEDFYSSLAQMADDDEADDDEDSMTELDAKNLANSLADMDDLDSDLFGDSLGRKSNSKPVSKPAVKAKGKHEPDKIETGQSSIADRPGKGKPDNAISKPTSAGSKKKFDISKYDSMDFDEDDPLAGLLSDDEDASSKKKPAKATKRNPVKTEPETVAQPSERPKTSRNRNQDGEQQDPHLSTDKRTANKQETLNADVSKIASSPRDTPTALSPRGKRSPVKSKNELSFDSEDDLPGIEESPRPKPKTKQTSNKPTPKKKVDDLFGDDDGLFGLDEGKPPTKSSVPKPTTSRFDDLLGGKKQQSEPEKAQRPKTLDDFMSNISTSKSPGGSTKKVQAPKEDEDSFLFGSYTPSAAGPGKGRTRPDTAPGSRRSVRFADELGLLGDELSGIGSRPATAPSTRTDGPQRRRRGDDSAHEDKSIKIEDKDKTSSSVTSGSGGSTSGGGGGGGGGGSGGADWLGLGGDDTGLELDLPTYKPPTPSRRVGQRTEPERTAPKQSVSPRNRQVADDENDFLKMLGITPEKDAPNQNESSFDGNVPRRAGRRLRDQSPEKSQDVFDLSSGEGPKQESSDRHQQAPTRPAIEQDKNNEGLVSRGVRDQKEDIAPPNKQPAHLTTSDRPVNRTLEPSQTAQAQSSTAVTPQYQPPQAHSTAVTPQYQPPQAHSTAVSPQYQSTPVRTPIHPNQSIGNDQKSQLEGEIHSLMRKLQDMESHPQLQDGTDYIVQLEAKVRRLQLENEHLQSSQDALKNRYETEKANIETSQKAHIKTLEESYHLRESRMKEEAELQASYYNDRIRALENEKTALQASHSRKIQASESSHTAEINRLKELHHQAIDEMRIENDEEIKRLRRIKDQEVSAVSSAHAHTKSLQSIMEQVLHSTKDVSDMRFQIEATHKSSITERESVAKARDEYLAQLQERLIKQQAENDQERTRLQGLIAKMEINIREQTRQMDQEKWKLSQDDARIKALQASLEEERRITMEQVTADRVEVQRAREELLREQKRVTTELQEERRSVAMERAQLSSAHREIITREKHKSDNTIQVEAELEMTATKVKQDTAALAVRQAQFKEEDGRLSREKADFEHRVKKFEEEKDRIGQLSLEVQRRSEEISQLCTEGARAREEGQEALIEAQRLRQETENEKAEVEHHIIVLHEKENQLAQDRVSIAQERRRLEMDKRSGRCRHCDVKPMTYMDVADLSPSPALITYDLSSSPQSPHSKTPDLLLNSLELKRNFRKWESDKDEDEEFLEQESRFLNGLRRSRNDPRPISSPS